MKQRSRSDYWTTRLAAEGNDTRRLWRSMNNVLRRGNEAGLQSAPVKHMADDFRSFFQSKVQAIHSATANCSMAATPDVPSSESAGMMSCDDSSCPVLTSWREVTTDKACQMAAPVKSSSLDPIPTFLLRECLDIILPFLTATVNTSDGLAQLYYREITTILDQLIPMQTVYFHRRASDAWFDDDCHVAKRCVRQFERDVRRIRHADPQNTTAIDAATAIWTKRRLEYRNML